MTRHRSFTTAAARRKADPIVWEIDGQTIMLRPYVDLVEIAEAVERVQAPVDQSSVAGIIERRNGMVEIISTFVAPEDRDAFESLAPSIDLATLADMTREAISEYAGLGNSGAPSSSSDGSSATGPSSTDGAPLTDSMP